MYIPFGHFHYFEISYPLLTTCFAQFAVNMIMINYQVGVQTEIEPDAGANALEDRVNAVMPLANKEDEDEI